MDELYLLTELEGLESCLNNIVSYSLANLGLVENMHISDDDLHRLIIHNYEDAKARIFDAKTELQTKICQPKPPTKHE